MKKLITFTLAFAFTTFVALAGTPVKTVVWCGVDYSLARFAATGDFRYGFNVPELLLPGMLEKWNQMFVDERLEDVAAALRRRVLLDLSGVAARNHAATLAQILSSPSVEDLSSDPQITAAALTNAIQSLRLENRQGLGLVFVVDKLAARLMPPDRLNSPAQHRCIGVVHVVFFDLATRQIIARKSATHLIRSGSSFRNFWFGPVKDADSLVAGCRYKVSKHP